jgi:DNA-binding LacI/PurR family transcriptional regulator
MKKVNKEVTIYDIARELDISSATVSRALNNHKAIGRATVKKVQAAAAEMGYRPNIFASSLRTKKTHTIGVIFAWINRPFISSVISGVEEVANEHGYNVIISQSNDSFKKEVANAKTMLDARIDGVIASLAMETTKYEHFNNFAKKGIPIVFVDRVCPDLETDRVVIDNYQAGYTATKHLIDQGIHKIAHFAGVQNHCIFKDRLEGYIAALKDYGIEFNEKYVIESRLSFSDGWKSMEKLLLLADPPRAVFSSTDGSAVGAIQYMKQKSKRIPQDVAVVGFNDDPLAKIIDPGLTTIAQDSEEMGRIAARHLFRQRSLDDFSKPETIILPTKLIVRGSSVLKDIGTLHLNG